MVSDPKKGTSAKCSAHNVAQLYIRSWAFGVRVCPRFASAEAHEQCSKSRFVPTPKVRQKHFRHLLRPTAFHLHPQRPESPFWEHGNDSLRGVTCTDMKVSVVPWLSFTSGSDLPVCQCSGGILVGSSARRQESLGQAQRLPFPRCLSRASLHENTPPLRISISQNRYASCLSGCESKQDNDRRSGHVQRAVCFRPGCCTPVSATTLP